MKATRVLAISVVSCFVFFAQSCKKNKTYSPVCDGSSPTYTSNIRSIINSSCTSGGCHPTYSSYAGIKPILDNGSFKNQVLTSQNMPSGKSLSHAQLDKIQCWVNNGYPE